MMMTTTQQCHDAKWLEAVVQHDFGEIYISHAPDEDLDGTFWAFDHDEQEMIRINGWTVVIEDIRDEPTFSNASEWV